MLTPPQEQVRQPTSREDAERLIRDGDPFTPEGAFQISAVTAWMHEQDPNGSTGRRYFHGGAPGLRPGDTLLPRDVTPTSGGRMRGGAVTDVRTDLVYVTPSPVVAWTYAAAFQQGWVYEVVPLGDVEPDAGWIGGPGVSFQTPRARVIRGVLVPDDVRDTIRAVYADSSTDSGWVECSDGAVRWGSHGGAGVLFRHPPSGRFYLHRRSATVDHPGTWALPGGALHEGETPIDAAMREAAEEIGEIPSGLEVTGVTTFSLTPEWTYTLVGADVPKRFFADTSQGESDADGWFTAEKMRGLRLHPDLRRCLAEMSQTPPPLSWISGNLWIGGVLDGEPLTDEFDHVVSLCPEGRYVLAPDVDLVEHPFLDTAELPDESLLLRVAAEVNDLRRDGPTLVHCEMGLNRSGLVAAAALVLDGMTPADAIALLRYRRSHLVLCNSVFERWVRQLKPARTKAAA